MPDLQMEHGSASAFFATNRTCSWPQSKSECSLHVSDIRLDSCMSVPLSFANKTNLCLILSSSSSKISDNHSGPNWGWKNHHAGIRIRTICDVESCVVRDQSYAPSNTDKRIDVSTYTPAQRQTCADSQAIGFSLADARTRARRWKSTQTRLPSQVVVGVTLILL